MASMRDRRQALFTERLPCVRRVSWGPPAVWALISTFGALAWFPVPGRLSGGAAYNEIYLVALAG